MIKKFMILVFIVPVCVILIKCGEDFLTVRPHGVIDQYILATAKGIDGLLIGAYSMLDGTTAIGSLDWKASSSNWFYGDIRGLVANIGSDAGDQSDYYGIIKFLEEPTSSWLDARWRSLYEAVSRCNTAVMVINLALEEGNITQEQAGIFLGQARALRGWFHFEAWRMWEKIPYIDEKTDYDAVTNKNDITDKILADLESGLTLPDNMGQIGRFNRTVTRVLLAKAKIQMKHDYSRSLDLLNEAINGTKPDGAPIGLAPKYGEIFDIVNRNGIESVYTIQYSVNDGSGGWNGGYGEVLNFPYASDDILPGCCGFFNPTQEFVNSFRTSGGLPLLDYSYNDDPVVNDQGLKPSDPFVEDSGPLDPRLDWSVGRRGIPYWDWGEHTGSDWIRSQEYSGPYNQKKQVYKRSQQGTFTETGSWTSGFTANGYRMIRYSDLLLLLAECQIETNDLAAARTNINLIRSRAANPDGFVKEEDGITNAANYVISPYPASGYPFDTKENARLALQMERKLELGMEGHRWFDLNRWGITETELNRVLSYEKTTPWGPAMYGNAIVGPEDKTYPIPQHQIDQSNGKIVQNR